MEQERRESLRISISLPFEWQRLDGKAGQLDTSQLSGFGSQLTPEVQKRLQNISDQLQQWTNQSTPQFQQACLLLNEKIDIVLEALTYTQPKEHYHVTLSHDGLDFQSDEIFTVDQALGIHLVLNSQHLICPAEVIHSNSESTGLRWRLNPAQQRLLSRYLLSESA